MVSKLQPKSVDDKRRFVRVPASSELTCVRRDGVRMAGRCFDVGRGGLAIGVGAPLPVGAYLLVRRDGLRGRAIELKTRVVWCAFDEDLGAWRVGLRAYLDESEAYDMLGELVFLGLQEAGALFPVFREGGMETPGARNLRIHYSSCDKAPAPLSGSEAGAGSQGSRSGLLGVAVAVLLTLANGAAFGALG